MSQGNGNIRYASVWVLAAALAVGCGGSGSSDLSPGGTGGVDAGSGTAGTATGGTGGTTTGGTGGTATGGTGGTTTGGTGGTTTGGTGGTATGGTGGTATGGTGGTATGGAGGGPNCAALLKEVNSKLAMAQRCRTNAPSQCKDVEPGVCCQVIVANKSSQNTIAYLVALDTYKKAGCKPTCPLVPCKVNPTGYCKASGGITGTCVVK